MSKKRMMSKQQRLYYEFQNKERVKQELIEYVKQVNELEKNGRVYYTYGRNLE